MSMTLSTTGAGIVVVVVPAVVVVAAGLVVDVGRVVVGADSDESPQPATAMPTNAATSAPVPRIGRHWHSRWLSRGAAAP